MSTPGTLDGASPLMAAALTLRFLLELALLAGVAIVVWNLVPGWWRWLLAVVAVAAVATLWGLFLSPKATIAVPALVSLGIEAALFLGVGAALYFIGVGYPALIFVAIWALDRMALAVLQR